MAEELKQHMDNTELVNVQDVSDEEEAAPAPIITSGQNTTIDTKLQVIDRHKEDDTVKPDDNVDQYGWPSIEHYIWDIGADEEIERLIDKTIRMLLMDRKFESFWKNKERLQQLYADKTFGDVISQILEIMEDTAKQSVLGSDTEYERLKKCFRINNKEKAKYLLSFLVPVACCIKYLEIEINAMPQYEVKRADEFDDNKEELPWEGFVVRPTDGTADIIEYEPIDVMRGDNKNNSQCNGCFVKMNEKHWYKGDERVIFCSQCIKFRVYQECVRKFVLEYDNEEIRDDLWPWYENNKNQYDQKNYTKILKQYADQVVAIEHIQRSNLKYYIPRKQTIDEANLDDAKYGADPNELGRIVDVNDDQIQNLIIKSKTQYQPYRNIRYLRKFAAIFLLGDREIWKDLLTLKKYIKSKGNKYVQHSNDKWNDISIIDDEQNFMVTSRVREQVQELLETEEIGGLLYRKYDEMEELGIDRFLKTWSRVPRWWEQLHDQVLLELALMHTLDISQYLETLDKEEYYQEKLEDYHYKMFEYWCSKEVNVQHRLRFLLYVIDQRKYPDSMVFMNDVMTYSHLNSFHNKQDAEEEYALKRKTVSKLLINLNEEEKGGDEFIYDEKPVRNIEREFRDIVQLLEPEALGERIWRFIMDQMAVKQRNSLWKALIILAEELPTNMIIRLLEEDKEDNNLLLRKGKPRYVNAVCQAIIKGSNYPVATALHLANYMNDNASNDLARTKIWEEFSNQYEDIAIHLINEIESDHLLALYLEIPTDIQQKTIIEMSVLYTRVKFINCARIQGVMTQMWSESEFLNPNKKVRIEYLTMYEFWELLRTSPVRFYYSPLGIYATTAFLYVGYLLMVSYVTYKCIYPYSDFHVFSLETLMWISNVGYILYELLEWEKKREEYFAMDSLVNIFDTIISFNWLILFLLRILSPFLAGKDYYGDPELDPSIDRENNSETQGSALTRTDPTKRNDLYTIIYMTLWSIQIIILWVRIVGLLQRTEIMGPLLRMMLNVTKDIASFMIVVVAITIGFLFAIYFIVGGDIDRDVTCDILTDPPTDCEEVSQIINSIRGITLYLIQTLLGQQDWEVLDANPLYGFERGRSSLLTVVLLAYVVMGTILSLNMLIAIMTTSFEGLKEMEQQHLAFLRAETTYDLVNRGRLMPPPFNIFVAAVWVLITVINYLINGLSCCQKKLNLNLAHLNPYYFNCCRGELSFIEKPKKHKKIKFDDDHLPKTPSIRFNEMTSALFESNESLTDDQGKRYCKYCYFKMKDTKYGNIDDYFSKLKHNEDKDVSSFGLDKDDMRMIKRLLRYCSLCPQCFRPYAIYEKQINDDDDDDDYDDEDDKDNNNNNNKCKCKSCSCLCLCFQTGDESLVDRHHVLIDVISCYFFLLLVWIPLIIICFIPAMFDKCFTQNEENKNTENKQLNVGAFGYYFRGTQQKYVKKIVDEKQYQGNDNNDNNDKLQKMIHDLIKQQMDEITQNTIKQQKMSSMQLLKEKQKSKQKIDSYQYQHDQHDQDDDDEQP